MRNERRVLLLAGVLLGLAPGLASACEQKLDPIGPAASARASISACTARVPLSGCNATSSTTCSSSAVAISKAPICPVAAKMAKKSRRHWSPGHLIEPDSMRLGPGDDVKQPDERWVIISSRTGTIHVVRTPWAPKKRDGRTLSQYGPYRS